MGVNPLVAIERGRHRASAAVWWAGVAIGAFNLIPVLPLDGGNVVTSVLDHFAPGKARRWMTYASVVITAGAAIVFSFFPALRGLVVFMGLLVLMQLQGVFEDREDHAVSIFDTAADALRAGDDAKAARIVTRGMRKPSQQALVPAPLPDDELHRLLAALPRPLPTGDPWNEYVLTNLLVHGGGYREAATYGAESYARAPQPLLAATIARAAGGVGDEATAIAWLRAAVARRRLTARRADRDRPRPRAGAPCATARRSRRCARRSSPPADRRPSGGAGRALGELRASRREACWLARPSRRTAPRRGARTRGCRGSACHHSSTRRVGSDPATPRGRTPP